MKRVGALIRFVVGETHMSYHHSPNEDDDEGEALLGGKKEKDTEFNVVQQVNWAVDVRHSIW